MLQIVKCKRYCPAIESEVVVDCQFVELKGVKAGPERVVACNSKHICKLVYENEKLQIKLNWQKCVLNS